MPDNSVTTTIILIRHAERANSPADDPHLNAQGSDRANSLVRVMSGAEIKAIYTSHFIRTKETAARLAAHLRILPVQLDDPADIRDHILKNYVGKNVLVVGHTDTVPELIGLLGDASSIAIAANEFDNLFVLTHSSSAGATSTVRFKYGNSD